MSNLEQAPRNTDQPEPSSEEAIHTLLIRLVDLLAIRIAEKLCEYIESD